MLSTTGYEHIILTDAQVPVIAGTNMKVVELVLSHLAYGWSPEELHFQYPSLTMGQIHSALAYYWDHKAEFDKDIELRLHNVDQLKEILPEPPFAQGLRTRKRM